jgi:WD40 repeat protein
MTLDLAFSPDGTTLAVGTHGRKPGLGRGVGPPRFAPLAHPEHVWRVAFSPDGSRLLTMGAGEARLWDARTGASVGAPMGFPDPNDVTWPNVRAVFDPRGAVPLLSGNDRSFRFWDAATTRALGPPIGPTDSPPSCFAFSPDGRLVVSGHEGGAAQVWDVATSRPLSAPVTQPAGVRGVAFLPDGRSFLTAATDGTIRQWSIPEPAIGPWRS